MTALFEYSGSLVCYPFIKSIRGFYQKLFFLINMVCSILGILPLDSQYSGYGECCLFNEYDLGKWKIIFSHFYP